MRIILRLLSYAIIVASTLGWSCTDEPAPESTDITNALILSVDSIEATAEGGELSVAYTLAEGFTPQQITPNYDAEWIESISCGSGNVRITLLPNNDSEPRTAAVGFDYGGTMQKATLDISQKGREAGAESFTIVIDELTSISFIASITAADKQMDYIMYVSDVAYFKDCGIDSPEALFEDNKFYYDRGAEFDGISLKEYMERYDAVFRGDMRSEWSNLCPGVPYILYIYGIEFNAEGTDYEVVTNISHVEITPSPAEIIDGIVFEVEIELNGPDISYEVAAHGWDEYYVVDILDATNELYREEGTKIDDEYIKQLASKWTLSCQYYINNYGMSYDDIIATFCHKGESGGQTELLSDTPYMMIVYAVDMVDGVLQVVSGPMMLHFTTDKVTASDLTLDIKVENLHSHICDLSITPSNDNEPYVMLLTPTSILKAGVDDTSMIELILTEYKSYAYTFRGAMSSHVNTLKASTEYAVFAFGYHGGVVTTQLFKSYFTTAEAAPGTNAVVEVAYGGPYDPIELADYNPEKYGHYYNYAGVYLMWMETITERPTDNRFHMFVDTDTYKMYGDEVMFADLVGFVCDPVTVTYGIYGMPYYVLGAAMDEIGNYSEMWRSESFAWSLEDKRPIEELIAKIEGTASTAQVKPMCLDGRKVERAR